MLMKKTFTIEFTYDKRGNLQPLDEPMVKDFMSKALHQAKIDVIVSNVTSTAEEQIS